MKTDKKIHSITILGRRWFQKSYGNTYFTAYIYVNGEQVHAMPQEYGYGDQYAHSSMDWLEKAGHITRKAYANGGHEGIWQTAERLGIAITYHAQDVARERDL